MIARLQAFLREPGSDGQPRTLLLTTHQAELARPLANTTLVLRAGRLVEQREADTPVSDAPVSDTSPSATAASPQASREPGV